jgi:hypothetical protein
MDATTLNGPTPQMPAGRVLEVVGGSDQKVALPEPRPPSEPESTEIKDEVGASPDVEQKSKSAIQGCLRTADIMTIDAAVIAYYNMIRLQGWIGNLALVIERELFGENLLSEFHGEITAQKIEDQIRRLADTIVPLQDRASRSMQRSLSALAGR